MKTLIKISCSDERASQLSSMIRFYDEEQSECSAAGIISDNTSLSTSACDRFLSLILQLELNLMLLLSQSLKVSTRKKNLLSSRRDYVITQITHFRLRDRVKKTYRNQILDREQELLKYARLHLLILRQV